MFKKKNINDELQTFKEEFNEYKKDQEKEIENIKKYYNARLFEIKYPVGLVKKNRYYGYCFINSLTGNIKDRKNIVYEYATYDSTKEIELTNLDEELESYKIYNQDNIIYIGIKSENDESYFLLDVEKELAIEIKNSKLEELDKINWTKIG